MAAIAIAAIAALLTQLPAEQFFKTLQTLETQLGRSPSRVQYGPRRIDLDLLVFGQQQIDTAELKVPHPGLVQRNFVLYPLAEIAPDLELPGLGRVAELKTRVTSEGLALLSHGG